MDSPVTVKTEEETSHQLRSDVAFSRFKAVDYFAEYSPAWSNTFRQRAELLWTIIVGDRQSKNEPSWAKCCHTLARRGQIRLLGHPKESTITISRLFAENSIDSQASFEDYLLKELPSNENRDLKLPQVNVRHPKTKEEYKEEEESCQRNQVREQRRADETESRLVFLEAMLEELTSENRELKDEVQVSHSD